MNRRSFHQFCLNAVFALTTITAGIASEPLRPNFISGMVDDRVAHDPDCSGSKTIQVSRPEQSSEKPNTLTKRELAEGWTLLFDGLSLNGWRSFHGDKINDKWVIDEGAVHLRGKGGSDLVSEQEYADFELKLQWKVEGKSNSGVFVRIREDAKKAWHSGFEIQVRDNEAPNGPLHAAGALYGLVAPPKETERPVGDWNDLYVRFVGTRFQYRFNGVEVEDIDVTSAEFRKLIAGTKFEAFPDYARNLKGHVLLQDHGSKVWYRNIKLRKISQ